MSESNTIDSNGKIEGKKYLTDYFRIEQREHDLTFHEWICKEKKKSGSKRLAIPHFVGPNTWSVWPVTEEYAKCMLKIYKS